MRRRLFLIALIAALSGSGSGQTNKQDEDAPVRLSATLVTVPVTVKDGKDRHVLDLRREDFQIFEDGVEQRIASFSPAEAVSTLQPFTVALLLDVSDSTEFQLDSIKAAAGTFVDQLPPQASVMVVSFDRAVEILCEPTLGRAHAREALLRVRTGLGGTSVYNAVDMIITQRLRGMPGRKALVLFSDGVDTTSRGATPVSNVRSAEESQVAVYPVQYNTVDAATRQAKKGGIKEKYREGPLIFTSPAEGEKSRQKAFDEATIYLRQLARSSGGEFYYGDSLERVSQAFARITEDLREQYVLGYYPLTPARRGERREIKVKVNRPKVLVRARRSYRQS
ncbi:MAG TPA: VWA domain-containing protein [Blastocatellia bacterium]|nr:VWA domain-containing protein [Blastocatellia bacterium]